MMEAAERIIERPYGRGMFLLPPGSAKSTYGSVVVPTWIMGKVPGYRMILASYGSDLARKHGRRARQICRSLRYNGIFGAGLSPDSSAAEEWALTNGSEYMAGGILSGITGNRANGIVIDDPVKGRDEADSDTVRKRTVEAYEDDIKTRLLPGGWMLLIQTRWHEDDLAGQILPEGWKGESGLIRCRDGFDWEILCLPAQCERADDPLGREIGEFLWPEWFDERHWAQFQNNPRTWSALYQQRPAPETGSYFKADWIKPYTIGQRPDLKTLSIYGASDYAVTADNGDYTVHGIIGLDPKGRMWLLDMWRQQASSDKWVDAWCDLVKRWGPIGWAEETGQIKSGVGPFLTQRARERKAYCAREAFSTNRGDKAIRAQSIRGRMALDGLYVPSDAPWYSDFVAELTSFPAGRHDDIVDMLGLAGQLLDKMMAGRVPKKPDPTVRDGYAEHRDERASDSLVTY